jgi:rRNA-processing protein FCF1
MRLRYGTTVEQAITALTTAVSDSVRVAATIADIESKRQAYLNWVDATLQRLRVVFLDAELEDSLLGRGYWHICALPLYPGKGPSARTASDLLLSRLIDEELAFQVGHPGVPGDSGGRIGDAVSRLRALTQFADRSGRICVVDTNALLHYTRFDRLPWAERLQALPIRLVIPIVVVDELDAKKYARREEFQQRARELLTLIDRYVTASPPDGYFALADNVTVEVLPDEPDHLRLPTNDQEILERCEFLHQVTGHPQPS